MTNYEGVCKYCGQIQNVTAESQEEADKLATNRCYCQGATKAKKREAMLRNAKVISLNGDENLAALMIAAGDMILEEEIRGITIFAGNVRYKISANSDGYIKFQRTETNRQELQE